MKNSKQGGSFAVIAGLMAVLVILLGILAVNVFELKKFADSGTAQKTTIGGSGVEIYLPETYYAASGLTMEIYNSQITNQGTHITEYNVVWECEVGEMLERKFSIAATDELIGEYPLTVTVYDASGKALARKVSTLSIVEAKQEEFSILAIGDSLSANGALYAKLQQNLGNQLICNGTRGYEGFLTEARLGFSAENYLTETGYYLEEGEEVHKFWNPESKRFDWDYYKSTTGFQPDVVQLHLGTNGLNTAGTPGRFHRRYLHAQCRQRPGSWKYPWYWRSSPGWYPYCSLR